MAKETRKGSVGLKSRRLGGDAKSGAKRGRRTVEENFLILRGLYDSFKEKGWDMEGDGEGGDETVYPSFQLGQQLSRSEKSGSRRMYRIEKNNRKRKNI